MISTIWVNDFINCTLVCEAMSTSSFCGLIAYLPWSGTSEMNRNKKQTKTNGGVLHENSFQQVSFTSMDVKWGDLKWQGQDAPKNWQLMFRHWKLGHIALRIQTSFIEITAIVLLMAKIHSANQTTQKWVQDWNLHVKKLLLVHVLNATNTTPHKKVQLLFHLVLIYIYYQPKITIKISSVHRQNLAVLLFVDHETRNLLLPKTVDFMAISCNFWGQERGDGGMGFFPGVQPTKGCKVVLPWTKWGNGCSQPILVWNQEAFWAQNCLCVAPCCIMLYYRAYHFPLLDTW